MHAYFVSIALNQVARRQIFCKLQAHLQMLCFYCRHTNYTNDTQILHRPDPDVAITYAGQDRCDILHHGE